MSGLGISSGRTSRYISGYPKEIEDSYRKYIRTFLNRLENINEATTVIGIPFYNETKTIGKVIETLAEGIEQFFPNERCIIVAVGSPYGAEALQAITSLPQNEKVPHFGFLIDEEKIGGKGWAIWAMMEIAYNLNADLAVFEADVVQREVDGEIEGISPEWVRLILGPIKTRNMDMVISRFDRHFMEAPVSDQLSYPLLAAIYNYPIRDLTGGQMGISYSMLRTFLRESPYPRNDEVGSFGGEVWLATKAITTGAKICEANLGLKIHGKSGKTEILFRHTAETLFEQISLDRNWWHRLSAVTSPVMLNFPATVGLEKDRFTNGTDIVPEDHLNKFRRGFENFHALYQDVLPEPGFHQVQLLNENDGHILSIELWTQIVYHFLLAFSFNDNFTRGDLINALVPLFDARIASYMMEIQDLKSELDTGVSEIAERVITLEGEKQRKELLNEFIHQRTNFITTWEMKEEATLSPIPKVTYREFIPGVHLVVPLEIQDLDGHYVTANGIYNSLFSRYKAEFEDFLFEKLEIPRDADSLQIITGIQDYILELESLLGKVLFPQDLYSIEGTEQFVKTLKENVHFEKVFSLSDRATLQLLYRYPPSGLITKMGFSNLNAMLSKYGPKDILGMASWSEDMEYRQQVMSYLKYNISPDDFELADMEIIVVSNEKFPLLVEMRECIAYCKLTGRAVISDLHKGTGGKFPKLRYFSTLAKTIIEIEQFSKIWQRWAEEERFFGDKLISSIEGHWGQAPLSAHNILENKHQRILKERVKQMASEMAKTAGDSPDRLALAQHIDLMADVYHLAFNLPDGTFIPCSVWTWASYSYKGGTGVPTPLSLNVERDWTSTDFLKGYFLASGGDETTFDDTIVSLMEQGEEWRDLSTVLLGTAKEASAVMDLDPVVSGDPAAGTLTRYAGNPILEPLTDHSWESKYVLNAGAIKINNKVYLVYRAFGDDNISRLGLAVSDDGFTFNERSDEPIFQPANRYEEKGCEDPRLTLIGDRIYMLYTAYNGLIAQIGMASITVNDFLNRRWDEWHRHGMVFPDFSNKDGVLFPEQFNGRYAMLHRVDPHIWITFSPHLDCPWPRQEHKILAGSTYGMLWDGNKIGGGAQPIKTEFGWLLIIHGVDQNKVYRLGSMLVNLNDPADVVYRSPNAILEPVAEYELGHKDQNWVPNVVFTCGAVPRDGNKPVLGGDDELLVYYGATDSVICVASAKIADLLPTSL